MTCNTLYTYLRRNAINPCPENSLNIFRIISIVKNTGFPWSHIYGYGYDPFLGSYHKVVSKVICANLYLK